MREAARGIASLGRYGDDTLLHVSRKELQGLRALTGKDFTTNPHTGLPEAFSWTSLIPIAAGIVGTIAGGPGAGALAAGAASAATAKAEGKSTEQALTQGLISGVTSYAGGEVLSGVGETATGAAGAEAAAQLNPAAAGYTGAESAGQAAGYSGAVGPASMSTEQAVAGTNLNAITGSASGATPEQAAARLMEQQAASQASGPSVVTSGGSATTAPQQPSAVDNFSARAGQFGTRVENVASDPGTAVEKIGANIEKKPYHALIAAGGTYAQAMDSMAPTSNEQKDTYDPNRYPEQFPESPRSWNAPPAGYRAGLGPEYRYFAKGGLASMRPEGSMTANIMNEAKAALLGEHPRPREALERFKNTFGQDALSELRDRITGGRVRGAGGGMDDLVPGTIEGRQKVRLADGEFVIPSDVVSGLGDGSTDQGVRRLHEMMNKVRQQRTGKTAQPKAIGGKISL